MTTKNFSCWQCKHWKKVGTLSGRCQRRAPHGMDYYGKSSLQDFTRLECGFIKADIQIGGTLALYRGGQDSVGLPSVPAAGHYNGNGCFPFKQISGDEIYDLHLAASLANVGTGVVGTNPRLHIEVVAIDGTHTDVYRTIEMYINPAHVGIAGNVTDDFFTADYTLGADAFLMPGTLVGFRLNLSVADNDRISEIRNPLLVVRQKVANAIQPSVTKYANIDDGTTFWCGEFVQNNQPVADPPVVE